MIWRTAMPALIGVALFAATAYETEIAQWRQQREANLKRDGGWLSVAGLFWLHEGANLVGSDPQSDVVLPASAPKRAGVLDFRSGQVRYQPASGSAEILKPDDPGPPDVVNIGSIAMTVIKRVGRTGVRLRDPNAQTRLHFTGLKWFPIREAWRIEAKWIAYPQPKKIAITNILGMTDQEPSPGYAEFNMQGKTLRLEPVTEDNELFFMFKDQTSGKATYGAGRFLYAAIPTGATVTLDFNRAENPPCAFTAFATCPLPPRQNWLPVSIEAGEQKYGPH